MSCVNIMSEIEFFESFCDQLVKDGLSFIYPKIYKISLTGWVVEIISNQNKNKLEILASGQNENLNNAIRNCVNNFNEKQAIKKRRTELLAMPEVREAMTLFGLRNIDKIEMGHGYLVIPCHFNGNGRKATVTLNANNPKLIHLSIDDDKSRPYMHVTDKFLHLSSPAGAASPGCSKEDIEMEERAIAAINIAYHEKELVIISDDQFEFDDKTMIVKPLSFVYFGASWHRFNESGWIGRLNADNRITDSTKEQERECNSKERV